MQDTRVHLRLVGHRLRERIDEARAAYERVLELVHSEPERSFLEPRLAELRR